MLSPSLLSLLLLLALLPKNLAAPSSLAPVYSAPKDTYEVSTKQELVSLLDPSTGTVTSYSELILSEGTYEFTGVPLKINDLSAIVRCDVANYPLSCILDAGGESRVLEIRETDGGELNLRALSFRNGDYGNYDGAVVAVYGQNSAVTFTYCWFMESVAGRGAV
jgi:hypothetical protein